MLISLHEQATSKPKIRAAIEASTKPAWIVAEAVRSSRGDWPIPLMLRMQCRTCVGRFAAPCEGDVRIDVAGPYQSFITRTDAAAGFTNRPFATSAA